MTTTKAPALPMMENFNLIKKIDRQTYMSNDGYKINVKLQERTFTICEANYVSVHMPLGKNM